MKSNYLKIKTLLQHSDKENKELGFQLLKGAGLPDNIEPWLLTILYKHPVWLWEGLAIGWSTQLAPYIKSLKLELKQNQPLPKELFQLHSLKRLFLRCEGDLCMPNISQHFGQLRQLEELRLTGSTKNGYTFKQVPSAIVQAPNLKTLHLDTNNITSLPLELAYKPSLKNLYLERNKLHQWPENLSAFSQLNFLSLKHNKLTTIPDSICTMHNLEALNLSYNKISHLPIRVLKKSPKLYYLSIKKNLLQTTSINTLKQQTKIYILLPK